MTQSLPPEDGSANRARDAAGPNAAALTTPPRHSSDVIVIGASAGGVSALQDLVRELPEELPAAVLIVVHIGSTQTQLASILDRAGPLSATLAQDREMIYRGRIYVAPADRHLILRDGHLHLTCTPKENWTRPAINPLFRSAARALGSRVAGVVLTGMLDDGTAGLLAIEAAGGVTIIQDPEDAAFPEMPLSALDYLEPDHLAPLAALPALMAQLTRSTESDDPTSRRAGEPVAAAELAGMPEPKGSWSWSRQTPRGSVEEQRIRLHLPGVRGPSLGGGGIWVFRIHLPNRPSVQSHEPPGAPARSPRGATPGGAQRHLRGKRARQATPGTRTEARHKLSAAGSGSIEDQEFTGFRCRA